MTEIAIIVGSTRPGRRSRAVAEWVAAQAARRYPSIGSGIVDLADFALPVLDEADPAIFVSYGLHGGTRAVEHLRLILAELQVATVRAQVVLSLHDDFAGPMTSEPGTFTPGPHQEASLGALLEQVVAWSRALQPVREGAPA